MEDGDLGIVCAWCGFTLESYLLPYIIVGSYLSFFEAGAVLRTYSGLCIQGSLLVELWGEPSVVPGIYLGEAICKEARYISYNIPPTQNLVSKIGVFLLGTSRFSASVH